MESVNVSSTGSDDGWHTWSCIEATGYFTLAYNQAMIQARENGRIQNVFQIESTTPCQLAQMAGFIPSFHEKADKLCRSSFYSSEQDKSTPQYHRDILPHSEQEKLSRLKIDWPDLMGGKHGSHRLPDDRRLHDSIYSLSEQLGYIS
jgi:hypothetical protein